MTSNADFSIEACQADSFLGLSGHFLDQEYGLCKEVDEKNIVICPSPVYPSAVITNVETGKEFVEIRYWKFGEWHAILVPKATLSTASKIVSLSDFGLEVTSSNAKKLVDSLNEILVSGALYIPHKFSRSSLGWQGDEFLPYSDKLLCDSAERYRQFMNAFTAAGSLEGWTAYFAKLRQSKEFRLMLDASFAAPLVSVVGQNSFILHLWGGTGLGKTVALMCALSVWGNPNQGALLQTLNKTQNAMLSTAGFLCNLPFGADELQTIKSRFTDYSGLIMTLCEGIDRARMHYNEMNETCSWQTSFLFTGEEPILKALDSGGARNRVLEIECRSKLIENGNESATFARNNYGTAGRRFIEMLSKDRAREYYRSIFNDIIRAYDVTEKQAATAALLLTADWLSSEIFWPDCEVLKIEDVIGYLNDSTQVSTAENAYSFVKDLIAEHASNFTPAAFECWGIIEGNKVYFIKKVLNDEFKNAGFDFNSVKSSWIESGYLLNTYNGKERHQKKINGINCGCACIVIDDGSSSSTKVAS